MKLLHFAVGVLLVAPACAADDSEPDVEFRGACWSTYNNQIQKEINGYPDDDDGLGGPGVSPERQLILCLLGLHGFSSTNVQLAEHAGGTLTQVVVPATSTVFVESGHGGGTAVALNNGYGPYQPSVLEPSVELDLDGGTDSVTLEFTGAEDDLLFIAVVE